MTENKQMVAAPETPKQSFFGFLGGIQIAISKKCGNIWTPLNGNELDSQDGVSFGLVQKGVYRIEIWKQTGIETTPFIVLNKEFYASRGQERQKGDLRVKKGEFRNISPWKHQVGQTEWEVFTQEFDVKEKYDTPDANQRNLYIVFLGEGGIQTFVFAPYHDNSGRLHLTIEQVWIGAVGLNGSAVTCPCLEKKQGGSPALMELVGEHYTKVGIEKLKPLVVPEEEKEKVQVGHLGAWGLCQIPMRSEDDPKGADTLEVLVDMISAPRWLAMGRDKWGRQIYLNWQNVVVGEGEVPRLYQGQLVRCKVKHDFNNVPGKPGKQIDLWRGCEITPLSPEQAKARFGELAKSDSSWVPKRDWWDDEETDNEEVFVERKIAKISDPKKQPVKRKRAWVTKGLVSLADAFKVAANN